MLTTIGDRIINLEQIRSVEDFTRDHNGRDRVKLTWADGSTVILFDDYDRIQRLCGHFVLAPHGFTVAEAVLENEQYHLAEHLVPVLGFRIDGPSWFDVHAVTPEGEASDYPNVLQAVVFPDGRCLDVDGITATVDKWKAKVARLKASKIA